MLLYTAGFFAAGGLAYLILVYPIPTAAVFGGLVVLNFAVIEPNNKKYAKKHARTVCSAAEPTPKDVQRPSKPVPSAAEPAPSDAQLPTKP